MPNDINSPHHHTPGKRRLTVSHPAATVAFEQDDDFIRMKGTDHPALIRALHIVAVEREPTTSRGTVWLVSGLAIECLIDEAEVVEEKWRILVDRFYKAAGRG